MVHQISIAADCSWKSRNVGARLPGAVTEHPMRKDSVWLHLCELHSPGDALRTMAPSSATKSDNHL